MVSQPDHQQDGLLASVEVRGIQAELKYLKMNILDAKPNDILNELGQSKDKLWTYCWRKDIEICICIWAVNNLHLQNAPDHAFGCHHIL